MESYSMCSLQLTPCPEHVSRSFMLQNASVCHSFYDWILFCCMDRPHLLIWMGILEEQPQGRPDLSMLQRWCCRHRGRMLTDLTLLWSERSREQIWFRRIPWLESEAKTSNVYISEGGGLVVRHWEGPQGGPWQPAVSKTLRFNNV